jgi:hypothetical protein
MDSFADQSDLEFPVFIDGQAQIAARPSLVSTSQAIAPQTGSATAGTTLAVTTGGITFDLIFDAAAMAAPASFRTGIEQAAVILANAISDKITVNLHIDYHGTGGSASAGPDNGAYESYTLIHSNLLTGTAPGDATFDALPNGSTIQGQANVVTWNAEMKLFGLMAANDTSTDDGTATFATDINPNQLVGVALHELSHALGRIPEGPSPDIFDFFRFSSPGNHLFAGGNTAPTAYFSIDGGTTKVADYGQQSDPADFLNSGVQGPNDSFNEFYDGGTAQSLSTIDYLQLHALGFHTAHTESTFASRSTDFSIAPDGAGGVALTGANQSLEVDHVEFLSFSDKMVFVEGNDNANVARLYSAALDRPPDVTGLSGWEDIFANDLPAAVKAQGVYASLAQTKIGGLSIAGGFEQSPEFQSKYGNLNDSDFVTRLYQNVLDRAPSLSEVSAWLNLIHNGETHDMVLVGFAESPENIAKTSSDWLIHV